MTHRFCLPKVLVLGMALLWVACHDDPECRSNTDCNVKLKEVCQKGKCRANPLNNLDTADTGTHPGSDWIIDTTSVTQPEGGSDSAVATDSTEVSTEDTQTEPRECVSNAQCDDGNPCTADFCNTSITPYHCENTGRTNGTQCSTANPCEGEGTCQGGQCVIQSPPCASYSSPETCVRYEGSCNAGNTPMCTYTQVPIADGEPCLQGDPCTEGVCSNGACASVKRNCADNLTPCTAQYCSPQGDGYGEYICLPSPAKDGAICTLSATDSLCNASESSPAFATGYCYQSGAISDCIIGDNRMCYDAASPSLCSAQTCVPETGQCVALSQSDVSIQATCGETVTLTAADFRTRDYYAYASSCIPYDARGKEAAITLALTSSADVTVRVTDDGGQDITLYQLADLCDPDSCIASARDELTMTPMSPGDAIIVEAGIGNPPPSITLTITCP